MMSKKDYYYWQGRFEAFDDFSDFAWWVACESAIGGYNKFMAWLKAGQVYDKEAI